MVELLILKLLQILLIDKDLKMPSTWKTSLAFDAKLPGDIDFSIEGIFNKDINPAVISNKAIKPSEATITFNRMIHVTHIANTLMLHGQTQVENRMYSI